MEKSEQAVKNCCSLFFCLLSGNYWRFLHIPFYHNVWYNI